MYCVIQKIQNKKANLYGESKKIEVDSYSWSFGNDPPKIKWIFHKSKDRFERPIKDAYKISIHKSYRENGEVKKKQWVICTMDYYSIADSSTWIGDYTIGMDDKLQQIGITEELLTDLVYKKLQPIIDKIKAEFTITEEYNAKQQHKEIVDKYNKNKKDFEDKYGQDTYDYCYDVFGTLRNEKYLKELEANYKAQQSYRDNFSSYQSKNDSNYSNNYSDYDFSSFFNNNQNTYTDEEREFLRVIYKAGALKLHPDIKKDNGEGMKFLNKLKDEWGI